MNGYSEIVGMLLVFCQQRGVTADSDELHEWVHHYFDVRFAEEQAKRRTKFRAGMKAVFHSTALKCLDRTCPECNPDPEQTH